ncbi:MAG TPA: hypothetical protein VN281_07370 [Verrucomicrobiae bacterium]|jgi:hypothetical protein|nr:hypothetical protein [Verrucomicrobiae bacterium]
MKMRNIFLSKLVVSTFIAGSGLFLASCAPVSRSTAVPSDLVCSNNLVRIAYLLKDAVGPSGAWYPKRLNELPNSVNPSLFICQGTGSHAGRMADIDDWTDLIYVGNLTDDFVMHVALVISPPENHSGSYGYVLFAEGDVCRLASQEVRQLINDPFSEATLAYSASDTPDNVAGEKHRAIINIPRKYRAMYTKHELK